LYKLSAPKLITLYPFHYQSLEQLRRDKVDLENSLEHEQEALFNTLGKRLEYCLLVQLIKQFNHQRMDSLEAEKRRMQSRLDELEVKPSPPQKAKEEQKAPGSVSSAAASTDSPPPPSSSTDNSNSTTTTNSSSA
jgi:hypothetical protein